MLRNSSRNLARNFVNQAGYPVLFTKSKKNPRMVE